MRVRTLLILLSVPLAGAMPVEAQITVEDGPLPIEVRDELLATLNAPEVLRLAGGIRIPAGTRIEGDLAILGGLAQVAGEVAGNLLVVNGDLHLAPGARVLGRITVVGGTVSGEGAADLGGDIVTYAYPLRYRLRDGRAQALPDEGFAPGFLGSDLGFGQARVTLRAGPSYNRVEGLPVRFGPIVRSSGSNPLTMEAFAIWRSVSGLNLESDRLGYAVRVQQAVGGRGTFSVGGEAYSEVVAIEDRGLSDLEASLSTFLLRRDPRDHYEREGWGASFTVHPARTFLSARVTYRDEEHAAAPLRNPWTLRSSDDPWRPLALPATGRFRSIEAELVWDSSDDPVLPSDGWHVEGRIGRQVGGGLVSLVGDPSLPEAFAPPFHTRGTLDVRRYARVGPTSRLTLRGMVSGALTGGPLPPQFQTALGGEGTLPGHPRFSVDCGARATLRVAPTGEGEPEDRLQEVYPAYGCDRAVLFQAEFHGALPLALDPVPEEWDDSELSALFDLHPTWAVFLNAGQGWSLAEPGPGVPGVDSPTRADVGFGLFLGPLGLYWTYPLNRREQGVNFFVRLQQRF